MWRSGNDGLGTLCTSDAWRLHGGNERLFSVGGGVQQEYAALFVLRASAGNLGGYMVIKDFMNGWRASGAPSIPKVLTHLAMGAIGLSAKTAIVVLTLRLLGVAV